MFKRVAVNAAATISHTWHVGETATDPTGTTTYAVVDANGTEVVSGNATLVTGEGRTTFALSGQSAMKLLTVTWTATVAGSTVVEVDTIEVVSGFFFTLAEARASDESLADTQKYTTEQLEEARTETEIECENICDQAFLPRYARVVLDGTGTSQLWLTHPEPTMRSLVGVRSIRSLSVAPAMDESFVAYTAGELAQLSIADDGVITRTAGNSFTWGQSNIRAEYEYGGTWLPPDLKRATLLRLRSRLNLFRSGVPERATSFTSADGGTYRITLPSAWQTGIPEVDGPYSRYSRRSRNGPNGKPAPASRRLDFNPSYYSLFHGGVR